MATPQLGAALNQAVAAANAWLGQPPAGAGRLTCNAMLHSIPAAVVVRDDGRRSPTRTRAMSDDQASGNPIGSKFA